MRRRHRRFGPGHPAPQPHQPRAGHCRRHGRAGHTTYYLSGALPSPIKPAANGQPAEYGDTAQQTRSTLNNLKAVMDKLGIGYGDVVAAHVFLDPKASAAEMK